MEVAWEALENGGQPVAELNNSNTGVFVGITTHDFTQILLERNEATLGTYHLTGMPLNFAAGRLSYTLGLRGPSMAVDTACSSSLVAVHLACQSLRQGECSMAIAGGVSLLLQPQVQIIMCKAHILSPSGRCRPFDAGADGIVRSDGCGVVVLKRLDDALAADDPIWGIIRGSAINQDGPSSGITVPNKQSQVQLIRDALDNAGIGAEQVGYVEAHGTGTPLGDPIEVSALSAALCQNRPGDRALRIGSVKANIGHAEAAAGVAGLIKATLALHHGEIPPHLHLETRTPHVPWADLPIDIPTMPSPWPDGERVAGVSSFGASGTNAHVVVSAAPSGGSRGSSTSALHEPAEVLLPLSARSEPALQQLALDYRDVLHDSSAPLRDVAFSASMRRSHHEYRLAVVGRSHREIAGRLSEFADGGEPAGVVAGRRLGRGRPKIGFIFPGQGSQWFGMGRELLAAEPAFREAMQTCSDAIARETGWSVIDQLQAAEDESRLDTIDVIQPTLFAIEVSLAALWRSWGITPDAVIGHSMGELAAAHVAGALELHDAVAIICRRSRLLRTMSGKGVMALVELDVDQAQECLRGYEERVSIAVSNSARSTVPSGEPTAMSEILATLEQRNVFCRRIKVDVASHSPQMDPLRDELLRALQTLKPQTGEIPIYSTVDGRVTSGADFDAHYWTRNLREPVQFARMIQAMIDAGYTGFVEISPHPILLSAVHEMLTHSQKSRHSVAVASLRRDHNERAVMLESFGALYRLGYPVDWQQLYPSGGRFVPIPTYPWQRERYWPAPISGTQRRSGG
ncbi:MAG: type I polyketide synthase, partial [Myxococcota bacterium]